MEYTELDDYPLLAGRVTTWCPVVDDEAWADDERALSWDHAEHLASGDSSGWIGSVMRLPRDPGAEVLRAALRAWLLRHEALRTTVVADEAGAWSRRTAAPRTVDLRPAEHGHQHVIDARATIAACFEEVSPQRWPHLRLASVVDDDGGLTVAFAADHSVMDAYSQLLWFAELISLVEAVEAGEDPTGLVDTDMGSHVDHCAADRARGAACGADDPVVERWRDFLVEGPDGRLVFPPGVRADLVPPDVEHAPSPQQTLSLPIADPDQTSALAARGKQVEAGMQAVTLALLAGAARTAARAEGLRIVVPMHTRTDPAHRASVGWYVGCAPVAIELDGLDGAPGDDDVLLRRCSEAVATAAECVPVPLPRVLGLLGVEQSPPLVASYVDTRAVPGSEQWPALRARALRSPAPHADEVYVWLIRSHVGLTLSARYPRTLETEVRMRKLVAYVRETLRGLIEPRDSSLADPFAAAPA